MSWESTDWAELFTESVTVNAKSGNSNYGTPTYSGSASTYAARVNRASGAIRTYWGAVEEATHTAWIASTSKLDPEAKFTLPDGTTPAVLRLTAYTDPDGVYFNKVIFGQGRGR